MTIATHATQSRTDFRRAWWKELWVQVMIAMAAGIALGAIRPDLAAQMQPLGDAFIKAIRMLIGPIMLLVVVPALQSMFLERQHPAAPVAPPAAGPVEPAAPGP